MKQLFLTSEVADVAHDISAKIKTLSGRLITAYITTPMERGHDGDDLAWHHNNRASMQRAGFETFEYTITGKTYEQICKDLSAVDVIYVEGGSLVFMLNQARIAGFDRFVSDFVARGGVYIGTSTGSLIAAKDTAPGLPLEGDWEEDFDSRGIGLVNFLLMPHWGKDTFRDTYKNVPSFAYEMKVPLIALNDKQYVWVLGDSFQIVDLN